MKTTCRNFDPPLQSAEEAGVLSIQPIPYQGSKRSIADLILQYFPDGIAALYEPFVGSGAVSITAASYNRAAFFHLNDINAPLIELWRDMIERPVDLAARYDQLWQAQLGNERQFFDQVRDEFNTTHQTHHFLYLLARGVKGAVRYNTQGKFNQSPDNRRLGRRPESMRADIMEVSRLFGGRVALSSVDYREILPLAGPDDLVYMDPPYQGVCTGRDSRYYKSVAREEFAAELRKLTDRGISYLVSYDGRLGNKTYGETIPSTAGVHRIEIAVGRSSQATLLGKSDIAYESLYLSYPLMERLGLTIRDLGDAISLSGNPPFYPKPKPHPLHAPTLPTHPPLRANPACRTLR